MQKYLCPKEAVSFAIALDVEIDPELYKVQKDGAYVLPDGISYHGLYDHKSGVKHERILFKAGKPQGKYLYYDNSKYITGNYDNKGQRQGEFVIWRYRQNNTTGAVTKIQDYILFYKDDILLWATVGTKSSVSLLWDEKNKFCKFVRITAGEVTKTWSRAYQDVRTKRTKGRVFEDERFGSLSEPASYMPVHRHLQTNQYGCVISEIQSN
ncbi:hypothetical protein GMAR_ORF93 [Golden Marseillevirus]|uniref:hypothetical protein n=1 Tax=Golden Marseillevirus TaxID=1720526 RepID=UPI000877AE9F|nr:hypothetical protein GMAR_ORF93 [Golden Marseillevirus]ALX27467.1 hypothetical protein GMAR_ORF93 [Golden Marseillevirus]